MRLFEPCYSDEIAIMPVMPIAKYTEGESWSAVVTSTTYLPRLQLFGGNANLVKEGKIPIGTYGLVVTKDKVTELGPKVDCLPISYRFKALEIKGDQIISIYNPKSPEFSRIRAESDAPDSGCMFGVEFLLWLTDSREFCTFYLSSKTARRQADPLRSMIQKDAEGRPIFVAATLKVELIKKAPYMWHGPVILRSSTPFDSPPVEDLYTQATLFANPKEFEVEKAETVSTEGRPQ